MHAVSYAFIGGEPIEQREAVVAIVEQVLRTLDVQPREIWCTKPNGSGVRDRAFSWERFLESVDSMATISGYGIKRSKALFFLNVALRHGVRAFMPLKYAPPALSFEVETGERVPEPRAIAAGDLLLRQAAASLPVISGGLTCFADEDSASAEARFTGGPETRANKPEQVRLRQTMDQFYEKQLWRKARRIYWETLLGPQLASKLGGAAAARAADAASVEEIAGSLLVHAGGPFERDDAPSFRARTAGLRAWLWPQSIQNPVDNPETT